MIAPALRRDIERAIDDFMTGSPRNAEALVRCLEHRNLTLDDESERDALRGKAFSSGFSSGVDAARDVILTTIRDNEETEAIDPKTRETIHVVKIDDLEGLVDDALEDAFTE